MDEGHGRTNLGIGGGGKNILGRQIISFKQVSHKGHIHNNNPNAKCYSEKDTQ